MLSNPLPIVLKVMVSYLILFEYSYNDIIN